MQQEISLFLGVIAFGLLHVFTASSYQKLFKELEEYGIKETQKKPYGVEELERVIK